MIRLPVGRVEITVGKPIEWDIFNEQGKLMLRRGMEIVSEAQLDRLTSYGMFRDPMGKLKVRVREKKSRSYWTCSVPLIAFKV